MASSGHDSEASSGARSTMRGPEAALSMSIDENPLGREQISLAPADEGYRAWMLLAGCFTTNVLIWGFSFSFGVLQNYYKSHEPFASDPDGIPAIGTTATGLMYMLMPVYLAAYQRWPASRKWSIWISLLLAPAALIGASFAETVGQLIVCQGVLFAIAGNALVTPTINYLDEWFVRRKGLAIGIMWAGDGTGGVLMPLLLQTLLSRYGFRWTLRAISGIIVLATVPLLPFLRPRLPPTSRHRSRPFNLAFMKYGTFWVFQSFSIIQALGYFVPINYLPSIAASLGTNPSLGSLALLITNLASIFGCLATGALVDRFDVMRIISAISLGAGAVVFLALGFSTSLWRLYIFGVFYGLTAGAYSTTWGGMIKEIVRCHPEADANIVFGFLAAGRGVGAISSGPLSESLLGGEGMWREGATSLYESQYGALVTFSACTAVAGGFGWFVRKAGLVW